MRLQCMLGDAFVGAKMADRDRIASPTFSENAFGLEGVRGKMTVMRLGHPAKLDPASV